MTKLQPAVMTLTFLPGTKTASYYDISFAASLVNRRFYRQGLNWAVSGFTVQARTGASVATGGIRTEILPQTWVCSNAWHKAFAMWLKQQNEIIDEAGAESAVAKFRDFKILMDATSADLADTALGHLEAVFEIPVDAGYVPALTGASDWEASEIVVPNIAVDPATGSPALVDPVEYYLHMLGVNNNGGKSRGIIAGYQDSRAYPFSPDPVSPTLGSSDNWMRQMFDVGNNNAEVVANATDKNELLPYDQDEYPGGDGNLVNAQVHSQHYWNANSLGNRVDIRGTNVPCGLVKLQNDTGADLEFQIHLVPGNHRGYLAEPMQDM